MFCKSCGAALEEGAKFCTSCGAFIEPEAPTLVNEPFFTEPAPAQEAAPVVPEAAPAEEPVPVQEAAPAYEYQPPVQPAYQPQPTYQPEPQPTYQAQPAYQAQQPTYQAQPVSEVSPTNVLVWGIIGLAFACTFYLSFLGIIFSSVARGKAKAFLAQNGGLFGQAKVGSILAKVGLILGIVMTAIFVIWLIVVIFAAALS